MKSPLPEISVKDCPTMEIELAVPTLDMDSDGLDELHARVSADIAVIEHSMATWSQAITQRRKMLALIDEMRGRANPHAQSVWIGTNRPTRHRRKSDGNASASEQVRKAAIRVLKQAQRPLGRMELLQFITAMGVEVPGKDPAKFVGRVLWRDSQFVNEGDGYKLVDPSTPLPEA